jgi:hypothetical protein
MTKTVDQAIDELQGEIAALNAQVRNKKQAVNTLCTVVGKPPAYALDADDAAAVPTAIRSDQFYGQALTPSVRTILEMRRAANLGAASNNEIFDALTAGGYQFNTKSDVVARASLLSSLSKNTPVFHKLPNGKFGLTAWYPNASNGKPSKGSSSSDEEANEVADAASPHDVQPEEGR